MNDSIVTGPRILLVDASIYFFRAYFSYRDDWFHPNGFAINGTYGYLRWLLRVLNELSPTYVAVAFDESLGTCFRNDLYEQYKISRELPDEGLAFQLSLARSMTSALGVAQFASERFEADDLLATIASQARSRGLACTTLTADKDLAQLLVNPADCLHDYGKGEPLFAADVEQKYGVRPDQFAQWLALAGDSSDDIPGLPGVGPKTAAQILQKFDNLTAVYADLSAVAGSDIRGAAKLADKLALHRDHLRLMLQLTKTRSDADVDVNWNLIRYQGVDQQAGQNLKDNGLGGLVRWLPAERGGI